MRSYARGQGCLMTFLQRALDDPEPAECGRCSVCTGTLPGPGRQIDAEALEAARTYLRGADVVLAPRKRWPAGIDRRGAIVGCEEGRALVFADTPGWDDVIGELDRGDSAVSDELFDGLVAVLGRWRRTWSARPRRGRAHAVTSPSDTRSPTSRPASPRSVVCRCSTSSVSPDRPHRATPQRSRESSISSPTWRWTLGASCPMVRCCWSTTRTEADGR